MIQKDNIIVPWRKNKTISILLALLFGPWTYIYTIKRDVVKAVIGLGLNLTILIFTASIIYPAIQNIPPGHGEGIIYPLIFPALLLSFTWLVVLIDTLISKEWIISGFKNKSKNTSLLLAIFFGPWTWLYSYSQDWWKFWIGMLTGYGFIIAKSLTNNDIFMALWVLSVLAVWITSIVDVVIRNKLWYEKLEQST